jgi:ATP adenylyltransferase
VDRIFAPWRMAYIEQLDEPGCIFCDKINENDDVPNLILRRRGHVFVILNLYPYNSGHLMVVPYSHASSLSDLPGDVLAELMQETAACVDALTKAFSPDGFNIGINLGKTAGAGVKGHVHMHVVPRWNGDTNFMPVLGETKILPDTPQGTFEKLREFFR